MKKLLSLALALTMALSLCVPAAFAEENSLNNFVKIATYTDTFTDVPASHWASSVVKTCCEYGLMNGTSDTTFGLTGDLTVAQALVMACRVHEIYTTGVSTLSNGSPWYQPYVDYALAKGIVSDSDFTDYNAKITRAEMAHVFYNSLNGRSMPAYNYIEYIPDVDERTPYASEILTLYEGGILTGSDVYGTFHPDATISRAEAAAIIARVAIPAERKSNHMLLEEWQLDNYTTFAMPQGAQELDTGNPSAAAVVTMDGKYAAIFAWQSDESLSGLGMDLIPADTWQSKILDICEESGLPLRNAKTELVYYDAIPAYRTIADYSDSYGGGCAVIISYITDAEFVYVQYLAAEYETKNLYSIANQFNLNGNFVNKKL